MNTLVSVIIPCYNEQATIELLLDALFNQTYPRSSLEVIIADGLSTDRTRQVIADYQVSHPDLRILLVDNPRRVIPAALNCAIAAARGSILVRMDGHCIPKTDYIARCVTALQEKLGDNIGGVWEIQPGGRGWLAQSIALAAAHRLGVGDARYRYTDQAGLVDTVPFGAFQKELIERIGGYDESLLANEDYEFNTRIRLSGGQIWLDPAIRSVYFARSSLGALGRQYWRYGYWKVRMLLRYPQTLRWRQALPPVFVLSLLVLLVFSFWPPARLLLGAEAAFYTAVLILAGIQTARRQKNWLFLVGLPAAIAVMHFSWGGGFLWSLVSGLVVHPAQKE